MHTHYSLMRPGLKPQTHTHSSKGSKPFLFIGDTTETEDDLGVVAPCFPLLPSTPCTHLQPQKLNQRFLALRTLPLSSSTPEGSGQGATAFSPSEQENHLSPWCPVLGGWQVGSPGILD